MVKTQNVGDCNVRYCVLKKEENRNGSDVCCGSFVSSGYETTSEIMAK